jgi:hypothetical protein
MLDDLEFDFDDLNFDFGSEQHTPFEEYLKNNDSKKYELYLLAKQLWEKYGCNNLKNEEILDVLHLIIQDWLLTFKLIAMGFKGIYPHFLGNFNRLKY